MPVSFRSLGLHARKQKQTLGLQYKQIKAGGMVINLRVSLIIGYFATAASDGRYISIICRYESKELGVA